MNEKKIFFEVLSPFLHSFQHKMVFKKKLSKEEKDQRDWVRIALT